MTERKLQISDFVVEEETEIKKNPFKYLSLPENSSPEDVRRAYIRLAKMYHPDMVNHTASDDVRGLAHKNMVLLNRAYEEIKSRHNPQKWNSLFGYDFETVFDEEEKKYCKVVDLEGRGKVTVFPNNFEYWVAGPYLSYDYDQYPDHPWEWGYQNSNNLRHMFAHVEIRENKPLNKVLVEPFAECFKLGKEDTNKLMELLSSKKRTDIIMQEMDIPHEDKINSKENFDGWLRSLKFRRHVNEINTLRTEPNWPQPTINLEIKDDKMTLEGYITTNFSEADYYLFLTLAYGPMLK